MDKNKIADNLSMPACSIIPVLEYENVAAAISWLTNMFGFSERWRVATHRAQMAFEGGAIAISEIRNSGKPIPIACILVRIKDADAHYDHVKKLGASIIRPPADFPYGERQYAVKDLGGHIWTFSQTIANVAPEEWGGTSADL